VLHVAFKVEREFLPSMEQNRLTPVEVECAVCMLGALRIGERYLVYAFGIGDKGGYPLAMTMPARASTMTDEIDYLEKLTAPGTIAYELYSGHGGKLERVYSGALRSGKALSLPRPRYPDAARAAGASGPVTVALVLDPSGTVRRAEAVCGHPLLRAAAEEAAKKIRYSPTKVNGTAVSVGGLVTYNFVNQVK
jgi:TonB family protein